ncbi:MAG TPA: glycosyltransferase family A protein [Candidatus Paceibacterota bacterium]|nr:glycosyltransferase family A protein [Candidatus Paceibacterota bacterium]
MRSDRLVSVIMPVFNTERYVAEAVWSVLNQTYTNVETICLDDGSEDNSLDILHSFGERVRVIESKENAGIGKARNKGLMEAKGDFIAFIDADDIWEKDKLEKQLTAFDQDPDLKMCFTYMQCFLSPELPEEVKRIRYCPTEPIPGHVAGTCLLKKEVVDRVGTFDETLRIGEFIDWNTRAQDAGMRSTMLQDILYRRRVHDSNTGIQERPSRTDYLKVVRNALERRNNKD